MSEFSLSCSERGRGVAAVGGDDQADPAAAGGEGEPRGHLTVAARHSRGGENTGGPLEYSACWL